MKIFFILVILIINYQSLSLAEDLNFKKIVSLNDPWGSSFLNNEEIIITEKSGKIKLINIKSKEIIDIKHNLNFVEDGQGGLLDIIHKDNQLWVSYSEDRKNGKTSTSIAKAKLDRKELFFQLIQQAPKK